MRKILSKSALVLVAVLSLGACSTVQPEPQAANAIAPVNENVPERTAALSDAHEKEMQRRENRRAKQEFIMAEGIDDYQAGSSSIMVPGQKDQRQLEKEKIHRLAKLCIQANNVSAPCQDIVRTNARMGKFHILQESQDLDPDTGKSKR